MKQEIPKHKMNKARSKHEAEALVCFLLEYFFLAMKEFFQVQSDNSFFDITILYYNPNIFPDEEYKRRLGTGVLIPIGVVVSVLGAFVMFKKGIVK